MAQCLIQLCPLYITSFGLIPVTRLGFDRLLPHLKGWGFGTDWLFRVLPTVFRSSCQSDNLNQLSFSELCSLCLLCALSFSLLSKCPRRTKKTKWASTIPAENACSWEKLAKTRFWATANSRKLKILLESVAPKLSMRNWCCFLK